MLRSVFFLCLAFLFFSCSTQRKVSNRIKTLSHILGAHYGISVTDLSAGKLIFKHNAEKYFKPASNIKIITLHASLLELGDSLIRYEYKIKNDSSIIIKGYGDPTWYHPDFSIYQDSFHTKFKYKYLDTSQWHNPNYGKGWMWDDFHYAFSPPLSSTPVYGNTVTLFENKGKWSFNPDYKPSYIRFFGGHQIIRNIKTNELLVPFGPKSATEILLPASNPDSLTQLVLKTNLYDKISGGSKTRSLTPIDTAFKYMMYYSDNLFAEQLLLQVSMKYFGIMNIEKTIDSLIKKYYIKYEQPPKWYDGSGVSHYNLCSPGFLNRILVDLWKRENQQRLLELFPAGGKSGTIENLYANSVNPNSPFVLQKLEH